MPKYEVYDDIEERLRSISSKKITGIVYVRLIDGRVVIREIRTSEPLTDTELSGIEKLLGKRLRRIE